MSKGWDVPNQDKLVHELAAAGPIKQALAATHTCPWRFVSSTSPNTRCQASGWRGL